MTQNNETKKPTEWKKRIGSTTYRVNVHFSSTSKDTMQDKLLRLMEREVKNIA